MLCGFGSSFSFVALELSIVILESLDVVMDGMVCCFSSKCLTCCLLNIAFDALGTEGRVCSTDGTPVVLCFVLDDFVDMVVVGIGNDNQPSGSSPLPTYSCGEVLGR